MPKIVIKKQQGFSLVEVLVSISVFVILLLGIYSLINLSLAISQDNKFYSEAISLANQKIEEIHNLAFDKVGTIGGIPNGVIPEKEIIKKSAEFSIVTSVIYYDDPYDGTLQSGNDSVFTDYKLVSLRVLWVGRKGAKELNFFTKIIPNTEESPSGYGLLKLSVVDANGAPIPAANVNVKNVKVVPAINSNYITDQNGLLVLPVPPSSEGYEVSVTKNGYSQEKTYARTVANPNPSKPNYTVLAGQKTEDSFNIDHLANLNVRVVKSDGLANYQIGQAKSNWSRSVPRLKYISDNNLFGVWQNQIDGGQSSVYWQKFSDQGSLLWSNDKLVSAGYNPDISIMNNQTAIIAWQTQANGNSDINFRLYNFAGQGIIPKKVANLHSAGDQKNPRLATIASSTNPNSLIVWQDKRNDNWDIYAQLANQAGQLLLSSDLALSNDSQNDTSPQVSVLSDGNFLVIWLRGDTVSPQKNKVVAQKISPNGEILWSEERVINDAETLKAEPELSTGESEYFYLTYVETGQAQSIISEKRDNEGALVWQKKSNQKRPNNFVSNPAIAFASSSVAVSWSENISNYSDVYGQLYDLQGNTLWSDDLRLNSTLVNSNQDQSSLSANSLGEITAIWKDDRNGYANIYGTFFSFNSKENSLAGAKIVVTGTKRIGENPVIYKVNNNYTVNAGSDLSIPLEWDTPGYTIKLNSSSSDVLESSEPEMPVIVKPGEGKTVILNIK